MKRPPNSLRSYPPEGAVSGYGRPGATDVYATFKALGALLDYPTYADYTLYEDDGVSYGYEKGQYTEIPIHWNETQQALTIGKRIGAFPGMLSHRTFRVLFVTRDRPVPFSFDLPADQTVTYSGSAIRIRHRGRIVPEVPRS